MGLTIVDRALQLVDTEVRGRGHDEVARRTVASVTEHGVRIGNGEGGDRDDNEEVFVGEHLDLVFE